MVHGFQEGRREGYRMTPSHTDVLMALQAIKALCGLVLLFFCVGVLLSREFELGWRLIALPLAFVGAWVFVHNF